MKKIMNFFKLAILILFACFTSKLVNAQYTLQNQDVTLDSRNYITACSYTFTNTSIIIPDTLQGHAIKGIGLAAFEGKGITSVVLPSCLERIEGTAFRTNSLTSINLPAGLKYIGRHSFRDNNLTSVVVPNSVEFMGNECFKNNNITSATLSSSLVYLGYQAFVQNSLSSITLPASINYIGVQAFISNSITSFVLPNNLRPGFQHWRNSNGDTLNPATTVTALNLSYTASIIYTLNDTDVTMENGYITDCRFGIGTVLTIPSQLQGQTVIGIADKDEQEAGVFSFMGILDISLPNNFKYLGKFSFSDNSFYFADISLPNTLEHIGYFSFYWSNIKSVVIPNSVTFIDELAFGWNPNLDSLILGNSVEYIGKHAFVRNGIINLSIPNSVKFIGNNAFETNAISTLTIGNSVVYIGKYAFKNNSLTSMTLPAATKIGHTFVNWLDENSATHNANSSVTNFDIYYSAIFTINNGTAIFNVADSTSELENAEVILNGNSYFTDYAGEAIIAGLNNGTHPYQVKKQGYFDATGNVVINNGFDSINVLMMKLTYQNVEFYVKDNSNNPISNATLVYDNNTLTTDLNGYIITQSVSGGTYSYVLSAPGFLADSGNITIANNDTIINLILYVDTTGINEIYDDISIKLYPNPVEDILQISFENYLSKFKIIEVISVTGQTIKSYKTIEQSFTIDMSGISKGLYFISISDENNIKKTFKVIRN
ncbi:MAG: leucine-rich repeat protein [Saprospiraceae bacterium]|nr:leucine-rich repeat protein [Saprospiraceae bacterium]